MPAVKLARDFVELAVLRGHEELHEVGAHGEVLAVAGEDEAGKVPHRLGIGSKDRCDEIQHIAADGPLPARDSAAVRPMVRPSAWASSPVITAPMA